MRENLTEEEIVLLSRDAEDSSKIYMLLSTLYSQVPNMDFIKKIKSDVFIHNLRDIHLEEMPEMKEGIRNITLYLNSISGIPEAEVADNLAVDFTKLFRGIKEGYGPPPPYESVWRGEGRIMGEWTERVLDFYRSADVGMDIGEELPDFIGIELKFMSILSYHESGAWKKGDLQKVRRFLELQQSFMENHIMKWVYEFCDQIVEESSTSFYKGIAVITKGFLNMQSQRLLENIN